VAFIDLQRSFLTAFNTKIVCKSSRYQVIILEILKYPNSSADFIASPAYFIGGFDIYDREETLGTVLNRYDPNDDSQLIELMNAYFFDSVRVFDLSAAHKTELLRVLRESLQDKDYDFETIVQDGGKSGYFYLPFEWTIDNPRQFFARIYQIVAARWS
jgi:hypothetical protein